MVVMMNKGLGKLILIAGLGLGALYFINRETKTPKTANSNSNDSKLTEAKVENFIKDEKKGQEEYKAVGLDNLAKDEKKHEEFLEKLEDHKEGKQKKHGDIIFVNPIIEKVSTSDGKYAVRTEIYTNFGNHKTQKSEYFFTKEEAQNFINKYKNLKENIIVEKRLNELENKEENKEEPKKVHRNKMSKEEFLAKMKAGREKKKMTKAEAGALGGEATAELGKHKGHKSKKGLVQDQNKVSKEEHEKHYQRSKDYNDVVYARVTDNEGPSDTTLYTKEFTNLNALETYIKSKLNYPEDGYYKIFISVKFKNDDNIYKYKLYYGKEEKSLVNQLQFYFTHKFNTKTLKYEKVSDL
jgi:hypothetical protein